MLFLTLGMTQRHLQLERHCLFLDGKESLPNNMAWLATLRRCLVQTQTRPAQGSLSSVGNPSSFFSSRSVHSSVHAMNRRSSHAVPLSENAYCQMAALDQALRFLLRPSLPQSCGWQPLRSDQLFEEILLCVILHADWLSRLEGHSCIIFMATKKN